MQIGETALALFLFGKEGLTFPDSPNDLQLAASDNEEHRSICQKGSDLKSHSSLFAPTHNPKQIKPTPQKESAYVFHPNPPFQKKGPGFKPETI